MDFKVVQKEIALQSRGWIPTFHDISTDVMKIVEDKAYTAQYDEWKIR